MLCIIIRNFVTIPRIQLIIVDETIKPCPLTSLVYCDLNSIVECYELWIEQFLCTDGNRMGKKKVEIVKRTIG